MTKLWITWAVFVAQCVTLGTLPIDGRKTPDIEALRAQFVPVMDAKLTGMEALQGRMERAERALLRGPKRDSVVPEPLIHQQHNKQ